MVYEPLKKLPDRETQQECCLDVSLGCVTERHRDAKQCVDLSQAAARDAERLDELTSVLSGLTFGDVGWNRNCRSPELVGECVPFLYRQLSREAVHDWHEFHGPLPHQKFPVAFHLPMVCWIEANAERSTLNTERRAVHGAAPWHTNICLVLVTDRNRRGLQ